MIKTSSTKNVWVEMVTCFENIKIEVQIEDTLFSSSLACQKPGWG